MSGRAAELREWYTDARCYMAGKGIAQTFWSEQVPLEAGVWEWTGIGGKGSIDWYEYLGRSWAEIYALYTQWSSLVRGNICFLLNSTGRMIHLSHLPTLLMARWWILHHCVLCSADAQPIFAEGEEKQGDVFLLNLTIFWHFWAKFMW